MDDKDLKLGEDFSDTRSNKAASVLREAAFVLLSAAVGFAIWLIVAL